MNAQQFQTAAAIASPAIWNITTARKVVTGDVARQIGLKKDEAAEIVFSIVEKRQKRSQAKSVKSVSLISLAEQRLTARLKKILPLRVSESSWAGSDYYDVKIARRFGGVWKFSQWDKESAISSLTVSSWKDYSSNGKWSGNSTRHTLRLLPTDTFAVIGGLFTITRKADNGRPCECTWYEQARGFEIREMHGFLVDGYHIEKSEKIETLEQAIAEVQRRAARAAKMENILTARGVMKAFHFCESGVRNFCEQNGIDFSKSRLTRDELAAIVIKNADYNRQYFGSYLSKIGIQV